MKTDRLIYWIPATLSAAKREASRARWTPPLLLIVCACVVVLALKIIPRIWE